MKAEIICEFQSPTATELVLLGGNLSAPTTDRCTAWSTSTACINI